MTEVTDKNSEWLQSLHNSEGSAGQPKKIRLKRYALYFTLSLAALTFLVILPFLLLIRTSLYLIIEFDVAIWAALAGGIGFAIFLLLVYILIIFRKFFKKAYFIRISFFAASVTVISFSLFSLFYLSGNHAKTPEIRELYRSMHPVLRLAVSSVILADNALLITDIERNPLDYPAMGLPLNPNSFHFEQPDGYVHAVDLRTIGRSFFRNILLEGSLRLLGFETLRHSGTADHLHVQIPSYL